MRREQFVDDLKWFMYGFVVTLIILGAVAGWLMYR